jgi:hypothetical protein
LLASLSLYLLFCPTRCQYVELLSVLGHTFVLLADGPVSFFYCQSSLSHFFYVYNLSKKRKETKIHMYSYVIRDEWRDRVFFIVSPFFFKFRFIISFHLDKIFLIWFQQRNSVALLYITTPNLWHNDGDFLIVIQKLTTNNWGLHLTQPASHLYTIPYFYRHIYLSPLHLHSI